VGSVGAGAEGMELGFESEGVGCPATCVEIGWVGSCYYIGEEAGKEKKKGFSERRGAKEDELRFVSSERWRRNEGSRRTLMLISRRVHPVSFE